MSLNRKTKAYYRRVKALARAMEYPSLVGVFGGLNRADAVQRVIAAKEPDAPDYLIEDALKYLIRQADFDACYGENLAKEARLKSEGWAGVLRSKQRPIPKFTVISGGAK